MMPDPTVFVQHPDGRIEIKLDLESPASIMEARDYVNGVVEDTVASIRFKGVNLRASQDEIRFIARNAARLALGLQRNPDREIVKVENEG